MTDYERGYHKGYADAMNWKTQNHLEHLPGRHDCPRCGHCCPQPNQELDFWALFDETQRLRAELKFNTTPRQWVGLTKEEAKEISLANRPYVIDMIAALEARLKEKNT
jgi:hypothetical protein